jgi:hypothetical protein
LRRSHGTIAKPNGIKALSAKHAPSTEIEPVLTTGRNLLRDLPIEYAKRAKAKDALVSTSLHNDMLALSESIILNHAAALTSRRRQLNLSSNHGQDDSRWQQEVESFIDEVIEASGCHVRSSPELLRAVRWMIASATAQFALPTVALSLDRESTIIEDAA